MPSVTCKECGKPIEICDHLATNFAMLAEQGETVRKLAEENRVLKVRNEELEAAVSDARPAVKWVVDHWGRTEPTLNAHDKAHADIALKTLNGVRRS